jgi:hypothetical protein
VQETRPSAAKAKNVDSFEIEGSIYLLLVSGLFFAFETVLHYEDFLHEITLKIVAPEALDLIIGSAIISLIYFCLGYSCSRDRTDSDRYLFALAFTGILVLAYFVVEVLSSVSTQFYYANYIEYGQFVAGYGSVTIFVELLVLLFTYRVIKANSFLQYNDSGGLN